MTNQMRMRAFWAGFIFHFGAIMAVQDAYGLERYITLLRVAWLDLPVWVGVLVMISGLVMYISTGWGE